jgi:hypothetical protein
MKFEDFDGMGEVRDAGELEAALAKRFGAGVNEFWLSHNDRFPALSIWVKDDLATAHFFDKERDPGFRSVGTVAGAGGSTLFCTESIKHTESVPNRFVIPYALALAAAKEFLFDKRLPASIEWMRL